MSVIFDGYEILPLGSAQLNIVNGKLEVTGLGNSGLDGFAINADPSNLHVKFDSYNLGPTGAIRTEYLARQDSIIYTKMATVVYKDDTNNTVNFGYDFRYVPHLYRVVGYLNGNTVFDIETPNPLDPVEPSDPPAIVIAWAAVAAVAAVVSAGVAVYVALKPSKQVVPYREYYPNGQLKVDTFKTIEDPTPIDVVVDNQTYQVDEWGIEFTNNYSEQDNMPDYPLVASQYTCVDVTSLTIESISTI